MRISETFLLSQGIVIVGLYEGLKNFPQSRPKSNNANYVILKKGKILIFNLLKKNEIYEFPLL